MPLATIYPDGDVTTDWDKVRPTGTHYTTIDSAVATPEDGDYIQTKTASDADEFTMDDSPGDVLTTDIITIQTRCQINDPAATGKIRLELFHTSGTPVTGNPKDIVGADLGGYGKLANVTKTWTGLSLTKAQTDSLQLKTTLLAS